MDSHVLFLPSVRREDCEEVIDDEPEIVLGGLTMNTNGGGWSDIAPDYEELPKYFIDFDSWANSTNLHCLACGLAFRTMPWFVPLAWGKQVVHRDPTGRFVAPDSVDPIPVGSRATECEVMRPYGAFCLPLCVKRYLNRVRDTKIGNPIESSRMLDRLVNRYYDLRDDRIDIPEAEDRSELIQHIGTRGMTPQVFRDRNERRLQDFLRVCRLRAPSS